MVNTHVVTEFRGEYAFLSNFYQAPFLWGGIEFPTGEHAFSYAKTYYLKPVTESKQAAYRRAILDAPTPSKAKYAGRSVPLDVPAWDAAKVRLMREIVHARFAEGLSGQNLCGRLMDTGASLLIEGNDWNDTFWGRCNGKGLNVLGVILMEERGYWLRAPRPLVPPRSPDND